MTIQWCRPIKIVEIVNAIYGRLIGNIKPTDVDEENESDVDITDVSKF